MSDLVPCRHGRVNQPIPPPDTPLGSGAEKMVTRLCRPFAAHVPVWDVGECPSCGEAPCGPHPPLLLCALCGDDYPCPAVVDVTSELEELAAMLDGASRLAVMMRARALRLVPTACSVCL